MRCMRAARFLLSIISLFGPIVAGGSLNAATTIRVGYPQLNGGQTPLWNIPENKVDQKYGLDIRPVYIPGGVRLTQAALSGSVDMAMTGGAAVNAMLSGAEFIYVGMPVPTYAFSLYARPEIKEVTDLRGKVIGSRIDRHAQTVQDDPTGYENSLFLPSGGRPRG